MSTVQRSTLVPLADCRRHNPPLHRFGETEPPAFIPMPASGNGCLNGETNRWAAGGTRANLQGAMALTRADVRRARGTHQRTRSITYRQRADCSCAGCATPHAGQAATTAASRWLSVTRRSRPSFDLADPRNFNVARQHRDCEERRSLELWINSEPACSAKDTRRNHGG